MKSLAILFSGQGAQVVGMGQDLAVAYPSIASMYRKADELLQGFKPPLSEVSFSGPVDILTQTSYCQPALYVHGLALLKVLRERLPTFEFKATAGLSLGEFTAHVAAGSFSFEDGLRLVAERGRFMQLACENSSGGMLSLIGASSEQAQEVAVASGVEIANFNSPGQIVLSGVKEGIARAKEKAESIGIKRAIELNVAGAYHSSLMDSAQKAFEPILQSVQISSPNVPVASNVTGDLLLPEKTDSTVIRDLLLRQITSSVRWESCIRSLIQYGVNHFLEIGPGKVLAGLCKRIDPSIPCNSIGSLNDLEEMAKVWQSI